MKIAIFHNFMDNIGGAEKVGLTLARELNADLYSTNIDRDKIKKMGFDDVKIISIGKIPVNAPFRQQLALAKFRFLNLSEKYDYFIIDGDWAMSGSFHNKPNLWYVHSPIREIWDLYRITRQSTVPWFLRWLFDLWVYTNRYLNKKYVEHVNTLVCNSLNTHNRVKMYLNRDSHIVHPPIDTSKYFYRENGNYWLSVNRLITHKRVDMQMKAFAKMPNEKLIIVGSYEQSRHFKQYANYIKSIKPDNVEIESWVDEQKILELYANCKGFITTSQDEDFGMTVVEAMASGKPVIAPNEGGYRESIKNNITGQLIGNMNVDKLIQAISKVGQNPESYKDACLNRAKDFDTKVFIKKVKKVIHNDLSNNTSI